MKLKAGMAAIFMALTVLASAEDVSPTAQAKERHWWTIDYVGLGTQSSVAGQDFNGGKDVKPFHNARKYGYDRGRYDFNPSGGVYLGHQVTGPFFVEVGAEFSTKLYEGFAMVGPTLLDNTVSSSVSSLMLAPVYRVEEANGLGWSLGCRLGYSAFRADIETSTASGLQGHLRQSSDIFAYEPFVRLDVGLTPWLKFGFDGGYSAKRFFPVVNQEGSGIYASPPEFDKNPDGTDTTVDFSGFTNKIFLAVVF